MLLWRDEGARNNRSHTYPVWVALLQGHAELEGVRQDVPAGGQGGRGDVGQWSSRVSARMYLRWDREEGGTLASGARGCRTCTREEGETLASGGEGGGGHWPSRGGHGPKGGQASSLLTTPYLPATVRALILPT